MKKLILLLSVFTIMATPISSVVSCSSKETLTEQDVYDKMVAIASEPIECNDPFLINYDSPNANEELLKKMFIRMNICFETSTNLINQLLTKIVYERVLKAIPNIKKFYPNFTLRTRRQLRGDIDQQLDNLVQNHKYTVDYLIFYNLHTLDEIKLFKDSSGQSITCENSNIRSFSSGFSAPYQAGEYLVSDVEHQTFSFTQSEFITDVQKRLDFYLGLYQTSGSVKFFPSEATNNSLNMFSIADVRWKDRLPQNVVDEIKNNSPEKLSYLKIIEDYIKDCWIQYNHVKILSFPELGLIDGFETDLTFKFAHTTTEIENNQKLNYVFGVNKYDVDTPIGFYNGVLIFDLSVKTKFENQTSQEKLNEKLYVRIIDDQIQSVL